MLRTLKYYLEELGYRLLDGFLVGVGIYLAYKLLG